MRRRQAIGIIISAVWIIDHAIRPHPPARSGLRGGNTAPRTRHRLRQETNVFSRVGAVEFHAQCRLRMFGPLVISFSSNIRMDMSGFKQPLAPSGSATTGPWADAIAAVIIAFAPIRPMCSKTGFPNIDRRRRILPESRVSRPTSSLETPNVSAERKGTLRTAPARGARNFSAALEGPTPHRFLSIY